MCRGRTRAAKVQIAGALSRLHTTRAAACSDQLIRNRLDLFKLDVERRAALESANGDESTSANVRIAEQHAHCAREFQRSGEREIEKTETPSRTDFQKNGSDFSVLPHRSNARHRGLRSIGGVGHVEQSTARPRTDKKKPPEISPRGLADFRRAHRAAVQLLPGFPLLAVAALVPAAGNLPELLLAPARALPVQQLAHVGAVHRLHCATPLLLLGDDAP